MTVALTYTVTMDARLAEVVGVPAAMLYNLLLWQSDTDMAKDYDKDGWFYLTAERFTEKTTFNKNTFTRAADKLVEVGLIERKRAYVKYGYKDANRSTTHFRIKMTLEDFQITLNESDSLVKRDLYIKEEKNKKEQLNSSKRGIDVMASTALELDASQASPAPLASSESESFPFDEKTKERVSVRPSKAAGEPDTNLKRRQAFAILTPLWKQFGQKGAPTAQDAKIMMQLIADGRTKEEMEQAFHWFSTHEFWAKQRLSSWLGKVAMSQFDAHVRVEKQEQANIDRNDPDYQKSEAYRRNIEFLKSFNRRALAHE